MAPSIAIDFCRSLPAGALVLDPMVGSGTTIRAAIDSGHKAIGVDMDPMAVLMTRAWTTPINARSFRSRAVEVLAHAQSLEPHEFCTPWIDDDAETSAFVDRWFGAKQQLPLRALATVMHGRQGASWDLCRIALSRLIITKDRGASLGRDVSHSRPHIVTRENQFDVFAAFERSAGIVSDRLEQDPPQMGAVVRQGDARHLKIKSGTIDAVITSPPYLNAIDYMRGHRMSLVWFGFNLSTLREIRGTEVGAERALISDDPYVARVSKEVGEIERLAVRTTGMVRRYVSDCRQVLQMTSRVLCPGGKALFVVGNSSIRGVYLRNDRAVEAAAASAGLRLISRMERELPANKRYLPPPKHCDGGLDGRMRKEVVLEFTKLSLTGQESTQIV